MDVGITNARYEQEFLQVMQAVKMALREPNVEPPDEFLMDFGNRFT